MGQTPEQIKAAAARVVAARPELREEFNKAALVGDSVNPLEHMEQNPLVNLGVQAALPYVAKKLPIVGPLLHAASGVNNLAHGRFGAALGDAAGAGADFIAPGSSALLDVAKHLGGLAPTAGRVTDVMASQPSEPMYEGKAAAAPLVPAPAPTMLDTTIHGVGKGLWGIGTGASATLKGIGHVVGHRDHQIPADAGAFGGLRHAAGRILHGAGEFTGKHRALTGGLLTAGALYGAHRYMQGDDEDKRAEYLNKLAETLGAPAASWPVQSGTPFMQQAGAGIRSAYQGTKDRLGGAYSSARQGLSNAYAGAKEQLPLLARDLSDAGTHAGQVMGGELRNTGYDLANFNNSVPTADMGRFSRLGTQTVRGLGRGMRGVGRAMYNNPRTAAGLAAAAGLATMGTAAYQGGKYLFGKKEEENDKRAMAMLKRAVNEGRKKRNADKATAFKNKQQKLRDAHPDIETAADPTVAGVSGSAKATRRKFEEQRPFRPLIAGGAEKVPGVASDYKAPKDMHKAPGVSAGMQEGLYTPPPAAPPKSQFQQGPAPGPGLGQRILWGGQAGMRFANNNKLPLALGAGALAAGAYGLHRYMRSKPKEEEMPVAEPMAALPKVAWVGTAWGGLSNHAHGRPVGRGMARGLVRELALGGGAGIGGGVGGVVGAGLGALAGPLGIAPGYALGSLGGTLLGGYGGYRAGNAISRDLGLNESKERDQAEGRKKAGYPGMRRK
jgi:hypothetical protein